MDKKSCYEILGLEYGADLHQIKTAYRKLSNKFHPDKNKGDDYFTKMYLRIKDAYDYLTFEVKECKEEKRQRESNISFENIYTELRELRFKLGGGTVFDDLEKMIHDRITNELLTLSKQDTLIKTAKEELVGKIIDEVYMIFAFIENDQYYRKLSVILMNLTESHPLALYSIDRALNMKGYGKHGKSILKNKYRK